MSLKEITVEDCRKRDPKATKITQFAETVESIGNIAMWIIFICGIVIALISGRDIHGEFNFGLFIVALIPWAIIGIADLLVYKFFSYMLEGIGEIVQNTRETANFARIYVQEHQMDSTEDKKSSVINTENKGFKRGIDKTNTAVQSDSYNDSKNKQRKDDVEKIADDSSEDKVKKVIQYPGYSRIICPYCGKEQIDSMKKCYNCGRELIK